MGIGGGGLIANGIFFPQFSLRVITEYYYRTFLFCVCLFVVVVFFLFFLLFFCLSNVVAEQTLQRVLGRKEMFYLTTQSTHFIYGYMASDQRTLIHDK